MNRQDFASLLRENPYPGRGIMLGRAPDGESMTAVYFIMGRSVSSRNRIFVPESDGIRTQAYDASELERPELLIYHPVREYGGSLIVTNGDQTDTIRDTFASDAALAAVSDIPPGGNVTPSGGQVHDAPSGGNVTPSGGAVHARDIPSVGERFRRALRTRTFEPDAPHYTPRISGVITPRGNIRLSILKTAHGNPAVCERCFFEYDTPCAGEGYFLHTYQGDGNPLPSFEGEPVRVRLDAPDARTLADMVWAALNPDNRVSLFVRYARMSDGVCDDVIINRHRE